MVTYTRPLKNGKPATTDSPVPVKGGRFEWAPARPEAPPVLTPATDRNTDVEAAQERRDRFGGVIAVGIVAAFVAFVVWLVSHGLPTNYDPTWDYWMY